MKYLIILPILLSISSMIMSQRAPFAGKRPVGYKDRLTNKTNEQDQDNQIIVNRFGADNKGGAASGVPVTTQRLPNAALGDAVLVDQLNQRPFDQRPFWLINYEAIEAQKNGGIRPAASTPSSTTTTTNGANPQILQNRFGEIDSTGSSSASSQGGSTNNYNVISKPEIVYPIEHPLYVEKQKLTSIGQQQTNGLFTNQLNLAQPVYILVPVPIYRTDSPSRRSATSF